QNVLQAEKDLKAAQELASEPGGQALLSETQVNLAKARGELAKVQRSAELAEAHAEAAVKTGERIGPLEQEIADVDRSMAEIQKSRQFMERATWSPQGMELYGLRVKREKLAAELEKETGSLRGDWVGRLRGGTPAPGATQKALQNLGELPEELRAADGAAFDITDPGRAPLKSLSPDHIHPVDEIVREPGFARLTPTQQREVLELQENYMPLSREANSSKGNLTMDEWFKTPKGSNVPHHLRPALR